MEEFPRSEIAVTLEKFLLYPALLRAVYESVYRGGLSPSKISYQLITVDNRWEMH